MKSYITQYKFAQICGVSKQAVTKGIQEGRIHKTKSGIDVDNPTNEYYRTCAEARKMHMDARQRKPGAKKVEVKVNAPPEKPPEPKTEKPKRAPAVAGGDSVAFDMFQKVYEETRLKKIQADTAIIKYAEKAGAVVDIESLKRKVGVFIDFLLTQLIYMPEDISDILWMRAKDEDDPERVIKDMLSERIEVIIKEAKKAAVALEPPDTGVKYIMLGMEDEEE